MINIYFLIKPSEISKEGYCAIYCRFWIEGLFKQKKEKSSKIFVKPENWDSKSQKIIPAPKSSKIQQETTKRENESLQALENKLRSIYNSLSYSGKQNITARDIKLELEGKHKGKLLIDTIDEYQKTFDKTAIPYKKINTLKKVIEVFLIDEYKKNNILLSELRDEINFLEKLEYYVQKGKNKRDISWGGTHIQKMFYYFQRIIKYAKKQRWIDINPFEEYKTKIKKSVEKKKIPLTKQELDIIQTYNYQSDSLRRYADIFLFQCYTSLRYSDVLKLEYSDIQISENGVKYFNKPSEKTQTPFIIPLLGKAEKLIEKYKEDAHTRIYHKNKCFPVKSNANFNKRLKTIADLCGIKKPLTTHVARYTCNQLLYEAGVSDEKRKQILGHISVKMTHYYTTRDIDILGKEMEKI